MKKANDPDRTVYNGFISYNIVADTKNYLQSCTQYMITE